MKEYCGSEMDIHIQNKPKIDNNNIHFLFVFISSAIFIESYQKCHAVMSVSDSDDLKPTNIDTNK